MKQKFLKETDAICFLHVTSVNWDPAYVEFFGWVWGFFVQHLVLNGKVINCL